MNSRPVQSARPACGLAVFAGAVLVLITAAAYAPCLSNGFIWDDDKYVSENQTLRTLDGLRRIWFESEATPQYYPIVHTTFWIEYRLWKLDPTGYHATNILLHGLGAVLLWRLLRRLRAPAAWAAAALFALHPVHVESVAWVTERKNVLSGVLYLGAAIAYLRFALPRAEAVAEDEPSKARGGWRFYALAIVLFIAALLSKTVTSTLPAALLLVLWWKLPRIGWRNLAALAPLFVIGPALGLFTVYLERTHVGAFGGYWDLSFVDRCLIAGRAICFYAGKLVWPADLVFFYPRWRIDSTEAWQYAYPALALGFAILLWIARRRIGKGPLVAYLFFAGTLFPALGFFDVYPMKFSFVADHFQYLASIGLIALAAAAVHWAGGWLAGRAALVRRAALAAVLGVFGFLTWNQCGHYVDPITLWTETIRRNPDAALAHNNLGVLLSQRGEPGDLEAAMAHFKEALRIDSQDAMGHVNIGRAYQEQGMYEASLGCFETALQIEPDNPLAHDNIGVSLFRMGRYEEAARHHALALQICAEAMKGYRAGSQEEANAHNNLGAALAQLGRTDEAVAHIAEAVKINPADPKARFNLGFLYRQAGRHQEALAQFEEVLRLASGNSAMPPEIAANARAEIELTMALMHGK